MFEVKRDGGWGWTVLLFVVCGQTILGGICLSSGLFYVIFMEAFNSNPVEISWLCSLPTTLWYISSPVGSFLTKRYGCRTCAFIGGIITSIGLSLGYFATNIGFLFFSHGFLTGLGFGINYTSSMTVLNIYFDKFRIITTGIASVGHNAGLVIYAKFTIYLQETYGLRGMMLIHGGIAFNICACALAMFPLKIENIQIAENVHKTNEQLGSSKKKRKSINFSILRKLSFILFCVSNVFTNLSYGISLLHLPSYSKDVGFTERDVGTVLIVFGTTNVVGKVFYSFLGQHPRVDVTVLYTVSLAATGIFLIFIPVFLTKSGMLTLAGLVGFFQCVTGALLHAVIYKIVGFERFADGIGMCLPFKAVGNLISGPLAGFLFASTGDYKFSFYLSGVCMIVSSVLLLQPIMHQRRREKMHQNKNIYTVCEIDIDSDTNVSENKTICNGAINGRVNGAAVGNIQKSHFGFLPEEDKELFLKSDTVLGTST